MPRIPSWRFRLSTLLLVVTVTALSIAWFLSQRKQQELVAENRELREELGRPVIIDPQRIAVGQRFLGGWGLFGDFTKPIIQHHTFRIYSPPGRKLAIKCAFENIDGAQPPNSNDSELDFSGLTGEVQIDIVVTFLDGKTFAVDFQATGTVAGPPNTTRYSSAGIICAPSNHWLLTHIADADGICAVEWEDMVAVPAAPLPDTPVVLVRYQAQTDPTAPKRNALLVWLEDVVQPTAP